MSILIIIYALAAIALAVYGFNSLLHTAAFVWLRWFKPLPAQSTQRPASSTDPGLPTVVVQLPIYNERYVVERLIDSVAALNYPSNRLHIQVLDDSTDDTVAIARAKVAHYKARGLQIDYLQRPHRSGYKAGALAYGLGRTQAKLVCIFDADFVPPADFLLRVVPHFADPTIGLVQARWGHLNANHSLLTRAQAFFLDGHFGVEQYIRSRLGLLLNFNGSAGVWRRTCIEKSGGWQADTLAEDLDLSYRAQLLGWQLRYLPEVVVPAEIPSLLGAFKRQQFRWAKGSIQCLLKNGGRLLNSKESLIRKIEGLFHLSGYIVHPLMMVVLLLSLPLVVTGEFTRVHLGAIGLAGFGAPILFAASQLSLYPRAWFKRLLFLPTIIFLGPGLALNNTVAILEACLGRNPTLFLRTPKFQAETNNPLATNKEPVPYNLPIDWTTWVEFFLIIYTGLTTAQALQHATGLAPFMASYAIGFGYTTWLGVKQALFVNPKASAQAVPLD